MAGDMENSSPDQKTAAELTEDFIEDVNARLKRLERFIVIRYLLVIVGLLIFGFGVIKAVSNTNATATRAKTFAAETRVISVKNRALVKEVAALQIRDQVQRHQAAYQNCKDQNTRHANTVKALGAIQMRDISEGLTTKARAAFGTEQTTLLINALAPKQNCKAYANRVAPLPKKPAKKKP